MQEFWGLDNLRSGTHRGVSCPKCGSILEVVANGIFHGFLFYCPKEEKVFSIQLRDITKIAGEDYLKQCKANIKIEKLRYKINKDNVEEIENLINKVEKL